MKRVSERNEKNIAAHVILRGGIFRESLVLPRNPRQTDAPILIEADPPDSVTVSRQRR